MGRGGSQSQLIPCRIQWSGLKHVQGGQQGPATQKKEWQRLHEPGEKQRNQKVTFKERCFLCKRRVRKCQVTITDNTSFPRCNRGTTRTRCLKERCLCLHTPPPPPNNPSLTQSRSRCVAVHPHPPTPKRAGVCKHAHVAASIHFCRNGVTKGNCHNLQTLFQTFCTFAPFSFGQSVFTHVRSWTQQSALSSIWPLVQGGKDRLF